MAKIKREELSGQFLEAFDKIVDLKNSDDAKQREAGLQGEKTLIKILESKKGQAVKKVVTPKAKATPKKAKATPKKAKATPKKVSVTETNPKGLPFATRVKQRADKDGITFREARVKLSKEIQDEKDKIEATIKEDKKKALKELEKITKAPEFQQALSQFPKKSGGKKRALKSNVSADGKRQALPRGKRISQGKGANQYGKAKKGKVYYEYRDNRSDVNSVPTKAGQYKYKGKTPPYLEAGGTLPTPFGQAGLVGETGTLNEVDLFAMGGGLPQGVHQYYANTYNPAYPTPHGYAKGGIISEKERKENEIRYIDSLKSKDCFKPMSKFQSKFSFDLELIADLLKKIDKNFTIDTNPNNFGYTFEKGGSMCLFDIEDVQDGGGAWKLIKDKYSTIEPFENPINNDNYVVIGIGEASQGGVFLDKRDGSVIKLTASPFEVLGTHKVMEAQKNNEDYLYNFPAIDWIKNVGKLKLEKNVHTKYPSSENYYAIRRSDIVPFDSFEQKEVACYLFQIIDYWRIVENVGYGGEALLMDEFDKGIEVVGNYYRNNYKKGGALNSLRNQMNDDLSIHSEYYAKGGDINDGYSYDIEYEDEEGDEYSETFDTKQEALEEIKRLENSDIHDYTIKRKYRYKDGEYLGSFAKGGEIKETSAQFKKRSEKDSIRIYNEWKKVLDSDFGDKEYQRFEKLVKDTQIPSDSVQKIQDYTTTTPRGQHRMIDIYHYWGKDTYAEGGEVNEAYIDYMNKDKGFKTDRKYFKTYEDAEKWARNEFERFNPDMISYTEYETPLRSFDKGGRTISIVNDGVKYDKSKYKAVYGDYDKDGVVNIDDANPLNKKKKGKVEEIELKNTFDKLLGVKAELDTIMYDAVDTLDEKAPKGADIYARTKTPYSILKKLVEKRMLDPKKGLTDMIGTTIAVDNQKELVELRDKIDNGLLGKVLDRDDFYKRPNAGYRAYHYIVEYKGVPVEVQLKTKNMKKLHEVSHKAYKNGNLDAKSLDFVSKTFMKADKGDSKAKAEIDRLLKDKKQLISKITKD